MSKLSMSLFAGAAALVAGVGAAQAGPLQPPKRRVAPRDTRNYLISRSIGYNGSAPERRPEHRLE